MITRTAASAIRILRFMAEDIPPKNGNIRLILKYMESPGAMTSVRFGNFFRNFCVPMPDRYIYIHQYFMILSLKQVEKISKALGDANRLKILQHISKKGGCGQCAEIQGIVDLTQPSISHHIKI